MAVFLTACSDKELIEKSVSDLNKRIDQLDITSEEILIRAASMNELELTVNAMEERQKSRLRKIIAREAIARKRVLELDADILEMEAKIKLLEEESKGYPKTVAAKKKATEVRLNKLLKEVERSVDLAPRPGEEKVVLIERAMERIKELEAKLAEKKKDE